MEIPEGGAEGMLITQGGRFAGWALYLLGGKPVFCYNYAGVDRYYASGKDKLAPGKHTVKLDFKSDGPGLGKGGTATLLVDGKPVGEDYQLPFKFTGTMGKVAIRLGEEKLSPEDQRTFDEIRGRGVMAE